MAKQLRVLIVDDEPLARLSIASLLTDDPEIRIAGECGSGVEAVEAVRALKPDILFLDVQMPECDGFEVLERLGKDAPRAVIFVTAYDQYAIKAFEAEALDYLLKPFTDARFEKALARAKAIAQEQQSAPTRLIVKSSGKITLVRIDQIDWIEAADYYACLHVGSRSHLIRRTLNDLESELDASQFCRVHRSAIVNMRAVTEIALDANGDYEVLLQDSTRVRMSRSYRETLQTRLTAMAG